MGATWERASRLGLAALAAVAFFFLAGVQLPLFFGRFPHRPAVVDFANYLTAAHVGLEHGWSRIYDPALQAPVFLRLTGFARFEWLDTFVSPPPVAWLAAPLTVLPLDFAYWSWVLLSAAALGYACWRVSPWRGIGGICALLIGAGLYPVLIALQFGQVTPVVAAGIALAWYQLRQGRQTVAAILLLPIALKPQVGLLVPLALGIAGYRRCFLVWAAGSAALAVASLLSLGGAGLAQLVRDLSDEQRHVENQVWTLAWLFGVGPASVAVEAVCVAASMAVGGLARGTADPRPPIVAGVLGSLLGAGYHHSIDFPSLLPLALLQLGTLRGWPAAALAIAGVAASVVIPRVGPGPILLLMLAWLGVLTAAGVAARFRPARPYVPSARAITTLPGASDE